jgi:hypothetical protein
VGEPFLQNMAMKGITWSTGSAKDEHGNISKMIEELRECGRGNMTLAKMNIAKHLMEKKLEFLEKEFRRIETKIEILTQWRREISDMIAQLCKQPTTGA